MSVTAAARSAAAALDGGAICNRGGAIAVYGALA